MPYYSVLTPAGTFTPLVLYMCHAGFVWGHDGQQHYIRAGRVADLYGVPKKMCIMVEDENELRGFDENYLQQLVHLFPRSSGDYQTMPPVGVVEDEQ